MRLLHMTRYLLAALLIAALCAALATASPDKPPPEPFCDGSSPGYCNPVDDPAKAIPPDVPPVVKLRAQLAKERRQHREAMRACKGS